jgi:hypothetical protein
MYGERWTALSDTDPGIRLPSTGQPAQACDDRCVAKAIVSTKLFQQVDPVDCMRPAVDGMTCTQASVRCDLRFAQSRILMFLVDAPQYVD